MPALTPDTLLDVHLSAICTRNQYTRDPGPVIAEPRTVAGDRVDILARVAGMVAGFYDGPDTHVLCAALTEIPGAASWVPLGKRRRDAVGHGTTEFRAP